MFSRLSSLHSRRWAASAVSSACPRAARFASKPIAEAGEAPRECSQIGSRRSWDTLTRQHSVRQWRQQSLNRLNLPLFRVRLASLQCPVARTADSDVVRDVVLAVTSRDPSQLPE